MKLRLEGAARLPRGEIQRFDVDGLAICVAHSDADGFFAVSDLCTHEEQSLSEGWLNDCEIECPRHHAIFSLRTGEALSWPAEEALQTFDVTVDGDDLLVAERGDPGQ